MLFSYNTRRSRTFWQPLSRQQAASGLAAFVLMLSAGAAAAGPMIEILSTPGCGCCIAWQRHLEDNGYPTDLRKLPMSVLDQHKKSVGLKDGQTSCHTGMVEGYVIEGHVPARDIDRLLAEHPDAIGLTVPDMPHGSPGMGSPEHADPYDVLLIRKDGTTEVFASYR